MSMDRIELKRRAMTLIQTSRPNPCLVTIAVLAYGWIVTWITRRIGGQPFYVDLDALEAMDYANVFGFDWGNVTVASGLLQFAFDVLSVYLAFGYAKYCLNACREERTAFGDLLSGFEYTYKVILLWFLTRIIVTLLSLLLIVPGIIAAYGYSMSERLQCDHPDWSPVRCMRESRTMMKGHKWELFVLELSFFGWILLSVIPVASIFVKPYITLTETAYYLRLTALPEEEPPADPEEKPPWEY